MNPRSMGTKHTWTDACDGRVVDGSLFGWDFVHLVQENVQWEPSQQKLDCYVSAHSYTASVPKLCTSTLRHKINKITPKSKSPMERIDFYPSSASSIIISSKHPRHLTVNNHTLQARHIHVDPCLHPTRPSTQHSKFSHKSKLAHRRFSRIRYCQT